MMVILFILKLLEKIKKMIKTENIIFFEKLSNPKNIIPEKDNIHKNVKNIQNKTIKFCYAIQYFSLHHS